MSRQKHHETMIRRSFYTAAQAGEGCDVTLVAGDGSSVAAHRLVLAGLLPSLDPLLCSSCRDHEQLMILLPGETLVALERARDSLYLFDDPTELEVILGLQRLKSSEKIVKTENTNQALEDVDVDNRDLLTDSTENLNEVVKTETLVEGLLSRPKPMVYSCNICNYNAFSEILMINHKTIQHERTSGGLEEESERTENKSFERAILVCNKCPFSSKQKKKLQTHILKMHPTKTSAGKTKTRIWMGHDFHYRTNPEEPVLRPNWNEVKKSPGADYEILFDKSFDNTATDLSSKGDTNKTEKNSLGIYANSDLSLGSDLKFSASEESVTNPDSFGMKTPQKVKHWRENASPMVYTCQLCSYKSFTKIMLNNHLSENHDIDFESMSMSPMIKTSSDAFPFCDLKITPFEKVPQAPKSKSIFESPNLRKSLSLGPQSDTKLMKSYFSPESSHVKTKMKDNEQYSSSMVYDCKNCKFKTFIRASLQKHTKERHSRISIEPNFFSE